MSGEPRVVVVGGARDHPAQIDDDDVSRRAVAAIWAQGALPFETSEPAVCDGIAQGHYGMTFSLVSRNITAAALVAQVEAHVYDAALVLDSCDKRPVADLAAVAEVDVYRRRRGKRPFYACFIPAPVMPERHLSTEVEEGIRALKGKAGPAYDEEIDALLLHRLKCNTYAMFKKLLDGLEERAVLASESRDRYLAEIAKMTCEAGGTCAFIGTGNTDKVVLHALGFVPRAADLLTRAAGDDVVAASAAALLDAVRNRREERSASALLRANLRNALRVWSAVGGSMNWALHFPYIAAYVGVRVTPTDMARVSDATPFLIDISPIRDKSFFTLAVEKQAGAHSGMDSTVKHLLASGLLEDAPTIEGPWSRRLADARDPNDRILYKTPLRPTSGIVEVKGNFTDSAVFKRAGMTPEAVGQFDGKAFVVVFYLGEAEAQQDLFRGRALERLRDVVPAATLRGLAGFNFGAEAAAALRDVADRGPPRPRRAAEAAARADRDRGRRAQGERDTGDVLPLRVPEPRSRPPARRRADHGRPILRRDLRPLHRPRLAGGPGRRRHRRPAHRRHRLPGHRRGQDRRARSRPVLEGGGRSTSCRWSGRPCARDPRRPSGRPGWSAAGATSRPPSA